MSLYIIKSISDFTQTQLNIAGVRSPENIPRVSTNGKGVLEVSAEVAATYFLSDRWYSLGETHVEMARPEWQGESVGFVAGMMNFFRA